MLHASSTVINDKAVLFAGESGKGKSTIVKNWTAGFWQTIGVFLGLLTVIRKFSVLLLRTG